MMAYNPASITPPDSPRAVHCAYCGERILFTCDAAVICLLYNVVVHADCHVNYTKGLQRLRRSENEL
jgi:hypothetical protein